MSKQEEISRENKQQHRVGYIIINCLIVLVFVILAAFIQAGFRWVFIVLAAIFIIGKLLLFIEKEVEMSIQQTQKALFEGRQTKSKNNLLEIFFSNFLSKDPHEYYYHPIALWLFPTFMVGIVLVFSLPNPSDTLEYKIVILMLWVITCLPTLLVVVYLVWRISLDSKIESFASSGTRDDLPLLNFWLTETTAEKKDTAGYYIPNQDINVSWFIEHHVFLHAPKPLARALSYANQASEETTAGLRESDYKPENFVAKREEARSSNKLYKKIQNAIGQIQARP